MGAEVVETKALGLKYPNGSIDWAKSDDVISIRDGAATYRVKLDCEEGGDCAELVRILSTRAQAAQIDVATFLGMHEIVSRTETVTISDVRTETRLDALLGGGD